MLLIKDRDEFEDFINAIWEIKSDFTIFQCVYENILLTVKCEYFNKREYLIEYGFILTAQYRDGLVREEGASYVDNSEKYIFVEDMLDAFDTVNNSIYRY